MNTCTHLHYLAITASFALLATPIIHGEPGPAGPLGADILYVGDGGDNSVKRFNADNGVPLDGSSGKFASNGLHGPRGLFVAGGQLIVVDQNAAKNIGGEILQFQLSKGSFTGAVVPKRDPNGPFAPRGAVLKGGVIYVANVVDDASNASGQVLAYSGDGNFRGELLAPAGVPFHPRGVVVGPNGLLYVSNCPNFGPAGPTVGGQVLRFDPTTLAFVDVLIDDIGGGVGQLNRPEGLVFAPDGRLCVTSFRATADDLDAIRIYDGATGSFLDAISLNQLGEPRAFAQALLFGPGGKLFVPITATGELRRYDLATKTFETIAPVGSLISPWFLTFGRTNAATLAYE